MSFCMDDNPPKFKVKTHEFGRKGCRTIWPHLSRQELTQQLQEDSKLLAACIDKKHPIQFIDGTSPRYPQQNQSPYDLAAKVLWTCTHWGTRACGQRNKAIIKADHRDPNALQRWIIGITNIIDTADHYKILNFTDLGPEKNVKFIAAICKKHRHDQLIQQLPQELLAKLAKYEPIIDSATTPNKISKKTFATILQKNIKNKI